MSYSTINNCNININNNIILSNNYIYNNKYLCYHNSQKLINIPSNNSRNKSISKSKDKKNKKFNIEQNKSKQHKIPLTSRNIRINLDNFRTEYNFLNSLMSQGNSSKTLLKNKNDRNENNIQYTSFRKSNNKEINNNKNRYVFKAKKINNNNKANKNLILKDVLNLNKTKSCLNKNNEYNSLTKTNKTIYIKNNNNGNNQRKFIFEYKKKYT